MNSEEKTAEPLRHQILLRTLLLRRRGQAVDYEIPPESQRDEVRLRRHHPRAVQAEHREGRKGRGRAAGLIDRKGLHGHTGRRPNREKLGRPAQQIPDAHGRQHDRGQRQRLQADLHKRRPAPVEGQRNRRPLAVDVT